MSETYDCVIMEASKVRYYRPFYLTNIILKPINKLNLKMEYNYMVEGKLIYTELANLIVCTERF